MIPKVIHYCWFGGNSLPEMALKCIESWKKYCPEYEIREWNESNFDIYSCQYIQEAAKEKKWAFVSDYARFKILYDNGGIYFDTDVELVRPIDDLIEKGPFAGIEDVFKVEKEEKYLVNPGLGIAAIPHMTILKEILCIYDREHYILENGSINTKTVLNYTTEILKRYGYREENRIQKCGDIYIYPADFFCPMNYSTGIINITENTYSIHHYSMSWKSEYEVSKKLLERRCRKKYGDKIGWRIYCLVSLPMKIEHKTKQYIEKVKLPLSKKEK